MDEAIQELLDALESAEADGAPLNDSVIRDSLIDVLYQGFVHQQPGYRVPRDLLLNYTDAAAAANAPIVAAWECFLAEACSAAASAGLHTPEERERAFLDSEVCSTSEDVSLASYFD